MLIKILALGEYYDMKILLIGHEKGLNGASRSLLNVADELSERGHSVYVLSSLIPECSLKS